MMQKSQQQGFTLIEALVAIAILVLAIIGPMTIAARGLQSAFYAKEQVTATYLAQEGLELVRMYRDQYAMANAGTGSEDWLAVIPAACEATGGCDIDVRNFSFASCGAEGNNSCRLRYDETKISSASRGMYTRADTAVPYSPYTRRIRMSQTVSNSNEVRVEVTVSWTSGLWGGTRSVVLRSDLFDQYDDY